MSSINPKILTQAVKDEAHRLGFQLVGVTGPDSPPHLDVYEQWLENGNQGGMTWLTTERARQRRANPLMILPECKSILVLGIRYPVPSPLPRLPMGVERKNESVSFRSEGRKGKMGSACSLTSGEGQSFEGRIASYAWGDDYHDVIPQRLGAIVAFIEKQTGVDFPNRWYTDTGPILERELAQRAGLGWIGKNTCLINPKMGSYFLLAEILLGIELEIDEPITTDHCGSCTRCLDACPNSCILPNRTVDSRRCISYLTIEHKGAIPIELRSKLGDWIFGCDVCQQVCPWNQKFSNTTYEAAFSPHAGIPPESLVGELTLTPQEFNRKFKGSPIRRTKRRGYLRNVITSLGNTRGPNAKPALINALRDSEPVIRSHAAWALGKIGGDDVFQVLRQALGVETDPGVKEEITRAIQSNPLI
jgi:epoxyqueuosine reductase